jgi:hypothetical protein
MVEARCNLTTMARPFRLRELRGHGGGTLLRRVQSTQPQLGMDVARTRFGEAYQSAQQLAEHSDCEHKGDTCPCGLICDE